MGRRHGLRLRIWIDNDDYYATYLTRQQRFYKHKSRYQLLIPNLLQRERENIRKTKSFASFESYFCSWSCPCPCPCSCPPILLITVCMLPAASVYYNYYSDSRHFLFYLFFTESHFLLFFSFMATL